MVEAHRLGLLRYLGQSPQGMAVYAYGDHANACFHSCLHLSDAERTPIARRPITCWECGETGHIAWNCPDRWDAVLDDDDDYYPDGTPMYGEF